MKNDNLYCCKCNVILHEIKILGNTFYKCHVCEQLTNEFGEVTTYDEIEKFFMKRECDVDGLFPRRKLDENEEVTSDIKNEELLNECTQLMKFGKTKTIVEFFEYEENNELKKDIAEILCYI